MLQRWMLAGVLVAGTGAAQVPAPPAAPLTARDPAVEAATVFVGRATFLRGGYAGAELQYDPQGRVKGQPKVLDWTLAGVNLDKVERRGPAELELDGVRVAVRYNPDQHVFDRKPQKDERVKIMLALNDGGRGLEGALAAMFAVGIDPGLQRAMPGYWRHYFSPGLEWPKDDLTGQAVIPTSGPAAAGVEAPVPEKKSEPEYTLEARADKVRGSVILRVTVGTDGLPRRIAIRQPLGYGLDERAVENLARYRFRPAMKDGKPVAAEIVVNQVFE